MGSEIDKPEEYIDFATARKQVPGRPSIATVWRWAMKGVKGIKLQYKRVGGRVYTTSAWLSEFIDKCGAIQPASTVPVPVPVRVVRHSPARRQRQIAEAMRELRMTR